MVAPNCFQVVGERIDPASGPWPVKAATGARSGFFLAVVVFGAAVLVADFATGFATVFVAVLVAGFAAEILAAVTLPSDSAKALAPDCAVAALVAAVLAVVARAATAGTASMAGSGTSPLCNTLTACSVTPSSRRLPSTSMMTTDALGEIACFVTIVTGCAEAFLREPRVRRRCSIHSSPSTTTRETTTRAPARNVSIGSGHALCDIEDLRDAHSVVLVDHDDLAVGDEAAVQQDVRGGSGGAVQLDHGAGLEVEHVAHGHLGATDLHSERHLHVADAAELARDVALRVGGRAPDGATLANADGEPSRVCLAGLERVDDRLSVGEQRRGVIDARVSEYAGSEVLGRGLEGGTQNVGGGDEALVARCLG